jgi:exosortase/archaeosortase family protein
MRQKERMFLVLSRYIILLLIGIFFKFLEPIIYQMTFTPSHYLIGLFYPVLVQGTTLFVAGKEIGIVPACIAFSAYYLFLILNLSTRMEIKKRILSIIIPFFLFLVFNILRIVVFSVLLVEDVGLFKQIHLFFWYFVSVFLVVVIWFFTVWLLKIEGIPVYSDLRSILKKK